MNLLEVIEYRLRGKGFPSTIVVDNDDNKIVYLRVLFIVQDTVIGLNIIDKNDYIEIYFRDNETKTKVEILDGTVDIDKILLSCTELINNNLDKIIGEEIR